MSAYKGIFMHLFAHFLVGEGTSLFIIYSSALSPFQAFSVFVFGLPAFFLTRFFSSIPERSGKYLCLVLLE